MQYIRAQFPNGFSKRSAALASVARSGAVVAGVVSLGFLSVACHDYRGEECRAFVISVNSKLEEIDRLTATTSPERSVSSADMRHLAELYEALGKKTSGGTLETKELAKLRGEYNTMVLEAARLARKVAEALDANDIEAAMKAHQQFGDVVSKEDILVGQVNSFCQRR